MHRRAPLSNEYKEVCKRFFFALTQLTSGEDKVLRGKATFCRLYNINRRNLWTMEKNSGSGILDPSWLVYLVRDYGVNADWLLTGRGVYMTKKKDKICRTIAEHKK